MHGKTWNDKALGLLLLGFLGLVGAAGLGARAEIFITDLDGFTQTFLGQKGVVTISDDYRAQVARVRRGDSSVELLRAKIKVDEADSMKVTAMTFFGQKRQADGRYAPAGPDDISSLTLIYETQVVGRGAISPEGVITFENLNFVVPRGDSTEFLLTGKIGARTDARHLIFYMNSEKTPYEWALSTGSVGKMRIQGLATSLRPDLSGEAYGHWLYIIPEDESYMYEFVEDFSTTVHLDADRTVAGLDTGRGFVSLLREGGGYHHEAVVQSTKINSVNSVIASARILFEEGGIGTGDEGSARAASDPIQYGIVYSLSADGGEHWVTADANGEAEFRFPGNDLRWKAELYNNLSNDANSPTIELVKVIYNSQEKPAQTFRLTEKFETLHAARGERGVKLAEFTLANESGEDFMLYRMSFQGQREGVYGLTAGDLDGAYLYRGETLLATAQFGEESQLNFPAVNLELPAQGVVALTLRGDIPEDAPATTLRFWPLLDDGILLRSVRTNEAPEIKREGASPFVYVGPAMPAADEVPAVAEAASVSSPDTTSGGEEAATVAVSADEQEGREGTALAALVSLALAGLLLRHFMRSHRIRTGAPETPQAEDGNKTDVPAA